MANQTKHLVHAMFKWAKQPGRKFVTVNPFADLPAPGGAIVAIAIRRALVRGH